MGPLQLRRVGATPRHNAWASHCGGLSRCRARAPERRLSSCGIWAQQLWLTGSRAQAQQLQRSGPAAPGMWDPPGPGLKPVSPALAGGFPTTAPQGKPHLFIFCFYFLCFRRPIQKKKKYCYNLYQRVFCLYFPLGVLWFLILHFSL